MQKLRNVDGIWSAVLGIGLSMIPNVSKLAFLVDVKQRSSSTSLFALKSERGGGELALKCADAVEITLAIGQFIQPWPLTKHH